MYARQTSSTGLQHWSRYWSSGVLQSLPQQFEGNYNDAVARFWEQQFTHLPENGRVMDVCSGNGAVALLAANWALANGRTIDIMAVDAADISPEQAARRFPAQARLIRQIDFRPRQALEQLQVSACSIDLITSQYGIEYCDLSRAATRVAHALRPGGRLTLMCHAPQSDVVRNIQVTEAHYLALEEQGFFEHMGGYLNGDCSFSDFNSTLARTHRVARELIRQRHSPFLATMIEMLVQVIPMSETQVRRDISKLQHFHDEFTTARLRQKDLLRVAELIRTQANWYQPLEQAGLVLDDDHEFTYQAHHGEPAIAAGHTYRFQKPPGSP